MQNKILHPISRTKSVPLGLIFATSLLWAAPSLLAQAAPAAPAAGQPNDKDNVVVLSPFTVSSENDDGYRASSTLAGTRIRTDLRDVGSSISVITEQFLKNTNTKNVDQLLVYTPSSEVVGQGGNFLGQGDGTYLTNTNLGNPISTTRIRGLAEADNTRDFYLSDIPFDTYNVGRVDLQRGPNSILFGIGSPAGIVNASLNAAMFKDANSVENQVGSFGTIRTTLDFNKVFLPHEFAARVSVLRDNTKFRQDPAFRDDHRTYAALRWDPSALNGGSGHTSIRGNFESGDISSNMPRNTPPLDAITPWFNSSLNRATFDAITSNDAAATQRWLGAPGGRVYDGVITTFNGASQDFSYPSKVQPYPNTGGSVPSAVVGNNGLKGISTFDGFANRTGGTAFPFVDIGPYKAKSLTDRSIFDFETNLLEGPNKHEFNRFHSFNLTVAQTFLQDKAGVEVAYDRQHARWGYRSFIANDGSVITVDIMRTLLDGSANPNVGRPMLVASGGSAGGENSERTREVYRVTAFGELNFADVAGKGSMLANIFGRNTFTGLYSHQKNNFLKASYNRYYLSDSFLPNAGQGSVGQASRDDIFYMYLGAPISGATTASNIHLGGLKNVVTPQNSTSINQYNNVTNTWQTIPMTIVNNDLASDSDKTYRTAQKNEDMVKSTAAVWQGYWVEGSVIPMFGYRTDTQTFRDAGNPPSVPANPSGKAGLVNPFDPKWTLPNNVAGVTLHSKTYSVVTHLPRSWREQTPGHLDVSLILNQSENFKPDSGRRDIMGHQVDNPAGKTREYGVSFSAFDDRVIFKVAHYKTKVANATIDSNGIGGQYLIGAVEAWGQQYATNFKNSLPRGGPRAGAASTLFGIASNGQQVTWRPDGPLLGSASTGFTYTQAQLDATAAKEKASVDAWFASPVPADFQNAWALTDYATGGGSTNFGASGLVVTGDTVSQGTEFELVARPIKGLDVSINASKTSAQRTNLAGAYVAWITKRFADFQGPIGDMRLWGSDDDFGSANGAFGHGGETVRGKYTRETMSGYNLFQALQNADVPELKPWAFNATANYAFQQSGLRNTNIGGSARWIDKSVTGFPVITNAAGNHAFDVANPYHGNTLLSIDLWAGYERKLTEKIKWRVQANVRNAFANDKLTKVTAEPDGSSAAYRIPEPRTFTLTNTFSF